MRPKNNLKYWTLFLTSVPVDKHESFVCSRFESRRITLPKLSIYLYRKWIVSGDVIRTTQRRRDYSRKVARLNLSPSDRNKLMRRSRAEEHLYWTKENWDNILWSDKSWVTDGWLTQTWVTRIASVIASFVREEKIWMRFVSTERYMRNKIWMIWTLFWRILPNPYSFWENAWDWIN